MVAEWIGTPARLMPMAASLVSWTAAVLFVLIVAGCASSSRGPAPVDSRDPRPVARPAPQARIQPPPPPAPVLAPPQAQAQGSAGAPVADSGPEFYTVKRGDTLFNIALDHGV